MNLVAAAWTGNIHSSLYCSLWLHPTTKISCVVFHHNFLHSAAVQVMAMIIGDKQAPWEDPVTSGGILSKLGFFNKVVLDLLQRDPSLLAD
jgi:hypothetical protein